MSRTRDLSLTKTALLPTELYGLKLFAVVPPKVET